MGRDIFSQEIPESESNKEHARDKFNRADLLVKNVAGELFIIQVQNETELDYLQRMLYGTSKLGVEHMHAGAPYANIKKIVSVSIVYFDLGKGEDDLYHGTTQFRGLRKGDALELSEEQKEAYRQDSPSSLYPEYYLIKVPRYDDQIRDSIDEWIYFLKNEEIKGDLEAKGLEAARQKLDILRMTLKDQQAYKVYLEDLSYQASMVESSYGSGMRKGLKPGLELGHKEGLAEGLEKASPRVTRRRCKKRPRL